MAIKNVDYAQDMGVENMALHMNQSFDDFHSPHTNHLQPGDNEQASNMRLANATSPMAMHKVSFKLPEAAKKGAYNNNMKSN